MYGLARRLPLYLLSCGVFVVLGCAAKKPAGPYLVAAPETTEIRLLKDCRLKADGKTPAEDCALGWRLSAVKIVKPKVKDPQK